MLSKYKLRDLVTISSYTGFDILNKILIKFKMVSSFLNSYSIATMLIKKIQII